MNETPLEVLMYRHVVTKPFTMIDDIALDVGDIYWLNDDGKIHRENAPAITKINGTAIWAINGKIHRKDGPAVIMANGSKYWYNQGSFQLSE